MSETTLMTEPAATTNEGQSASQPTDQAATGAVTEGQQQQTESQPAEGQAAQGEAQSKPEGAPEKYEFQAPEGQAFDAQVLDQFSEVAKELNLTQDNAQKMLDKMAPAIQARQQEQLQAFREDWAAQAKADKEYGGDKLAENIGAAQKALDSFGSQEFKTLLNETGLGNHPEVIRFMVRAGKAMGEDRIITGASGAPVSDARGLYSKSNMNP